MAAPLVGSEYPFECAIEGGPSYQETYRIISADGGVIRVEVQTGDSKNWYEKPYYLSGTTLVAREKGANGAVSMGLADDFEDLGQLQIGSKISDYVEEERAGGTLYWKYTVALTGRELAYVQGVGDLEVVAISESRWVDLYSSSMMALYSPELRFPIHWRYTDNNKNAIECNLTSAAGILLPTVDKLTASDPEPTVVANETQPASSQSDVATDQIEATPPADEDIAVSPPEAVEEAETQTAALDPSGDRVRRIACRNRGDVRALGRIEHQRPPRAVG